jgi:hypothetical protein
MESQMNKDKFDQITSKQLELAASLYGEKTQYLRLFKAYNAWAAVNLCQKHSTHDSIFFIVDEGAFGFKTVKFYLDGEDYRVGGYNASLAEAYNEAIHVL